MVIDSFTGKYSFLSNFYPCNIEFEGLYYPSVEHAYQAAKTLDNNERQSIRMCGYPGSAKRLGQKVKIRDNWDEIKITVMEDLVRQKFMYIDVLTQMLLETGEDYLVEGNNWGDTFWGMCNGKGENHLGKILMKIREELWKTEV